MRFFQVLVVACVFTVFALFFMESRLPWLRCWPPTDMHEAEVDELRKLNETIAVHTKLLASNRQLDA